MSCTTIGPCILLFFVSLSRCKWYIQASLTLISSPFLIDFNRMVHKVLAEFGEAAMVGAKAIIDGLVVPMNPNEPARSHVYFHNNIFFSRAVDAGVDTFKISQGDRAARKAASRDANCMGMLHRADIKGLHNLATVLVDYLGTRIVCQSVVPGILQGEKTHTLLYGSVEATQPLSWDEDLHKLLEESLGRGFMIATRSVPTLPLSDERMALIEKLRAASLENLSAMGVPLAGLYHENNNKETKPLTELCAPLEAKGIRGSDKGTISWISLALPQGMPIGSRNQRVELEDGKPWPR